MTVLVLGGSSQIGHFLLPRLSACGEPVIALSRHPQPAQPGVRWLLGELPDAVRRAMETGLVSGGVRWCWMEFPDLEAAQAFVHVVRLKHLILARPD